MNARHVHESEKSDVKEDETASSMHLGSTVSFT
jgi:hypothetical protein